MVERTRPLRLLVFAPSRRRASETFVRANLAGLPFDLVAYCGDELPLGGPPLRLAYGLAIVFSKVCERLGWLRLSTWLPSRVAIAICRQERPQVVLAEFGFHAVRIMELVPATGLPLVVHFRGADASSRRFLGRLSERYRRLFELAAAVVVKSGPMRDTLQPLFPEPRLQTLPVLISPSGADPVRFGAEPADPAGASPIFLAVGRFVPKKGPLITLEAFAEVAASRPDLRLVMVGDGPLLATARRRAQELGLHEQVRFLGWCSPEEIAGWMRRSRGFVQHSLTGSDGDQEGSPVAVIEAQLIGLPVVSTRHAGIPEVVVDGATGLLVAEGDRQGMAQAMARLADDPSLAATLGRAGRRRCLASFTVNHHLEALTELITGLAAPREPRAGS